MQEFLVEEFSSQESYRRFIKYMLSHSQFFLLSISGIGKMSR